MNYLILKSLHIISVVTWFAGLFYIPRLFVYFAEAELKSVVEKNILQNQFKIMQKRLWYGITLPSSLFVLIFGSSLAFHFWPFTGQSWLQIKLVFVCGLYLYQYFLHRIFTQQQQNIIKYTSMQLRMINEIAVLFLVAIVFLVVLKNILSMIYGVIAMILLIIILLLIIKIYKKIRQN